MQVLSRLKLLKDRLFSRYLLITNTAVGVAFMGAGDYVQQTIERKIYSKESYDTKRTENMMTVGIGFGFVAHFWYKWLDKKFPGSSTRIVLKKLLAEGAACPPFCYGFFMSMGFLQNKSAKESYNDFKKNVLIICLVDWMIYLPLQSLNFFFLPPKYRVLYVCSLTFVYDIFLSYIVHKDQNKQLKKLKQS